VINAPAEHAARWHRAASSLAPQTDLSQAWAEARAEARWRRRVALAREVAAWVFPAAVGALAAVLVAYA
jgi:hypothetical protein